MRGTRVDGSLTIIQVDARLAEVKDAGLSRLIEKFNTMDHNKSVISIRPSFARLRASSSQAARTNSLNKCSRMWTRMVMA